MDAMAKMEKNKNSFTVKALSYATKDIVEKFDFKTFVSLQRTCKYLHQVTQKAAIYQTVTIWEYLLEEGTDHSIEPQPEELLQSNFKLNIEHLEIDRELNDDVVCNAFLDLARRKSSVDTLTISGTVSCSLLKFTQFVKTFNISKINFCHNCPIEYHDSPIMHKVESLDLNDFPAGVSPDFLLRSNIPKAAIYFGTDLSKEFLRRILMEVAAGTRYINGWNIGPFPTAELESLLNMWTIVDFDRRHEHAAMNRGIPFVVKKAAHAYALVATEGLLEIEVNLEYGKDPGLLLWSFIHSVL